MRLDGLGLTYIALALVRSVNRASMDDHRHARANLKPVERLRDVPQHCGVSFSAVSGALGAGLRLGPVDPLTSHLEVFATALFILPFALPLLALLLPLARLPVVLLLFDGPVAYVDADGSDLGSTLR